MTLIRSHRILVLFLWLDFSWSSPVTPSQNSPHIPLEDDLLLDSMYFHLVRLPSLDQDGNPKIRLDVSPYPTSPSYARITAKVSENPWSVFGLYHARLVELKIDPHLHLDGTGLAYLTMLTQLTKLDVPCQGMTTQHLAHVTALTQLQSLNLDSNHFSLREAKALTSLCNLTELNLDHLERGPSTPWWLTQLTNLKVLRCNTLKRKDRTAMPSLPIQPPATQAHTVQQSPYPLVLLGPEEEEIRD
ncbi:MAG: hypothetical protein ACK5O7_05335 [Holosporales bacterium]